jgi:ribosomal protein S28E/S33
MYLLHLARVHSRTADRAPVRNGCCSLLAATDRGRDIQRTVAGTIFVKILIPVVTWTDEVDVPLFYS